MLIAVSTIIQGIDVTIVVNELAMELMNPLIPEENEVPLTKEDMKALAAIATSSITTILNRNTILTSYTSVHTRQDTRYYSQHYVDNQTRYISDDSHYSRSETRYY